MDVSPRKHASILTLCENTEKTYREISKIVGVSRGDVGPMKQKVSLGRWRDGFLCILHHICVLYSLQWYVL